VIGSLGWWLRGVDCALKWIAEEKVKLVSNAEIAIENVCAASWLSWFTARQYCNDQRVPNHTEDKS
jgi:hypothetical protein